MRVDGFPEHLQRVIKVRLVGDIEEKIEAALRLGGKVDEWVAPDLVIGDRDDLVVDLPQRGREGRDVGDRAIKPRDADIIPDAKRPEDREHHAGGNGFQCVLQRQTDRETRGAEDRGERGGGEAELRQGKDNRDGEDDVLDQRGREGDQRIVGAGMGVRLGAEPAERPRQRIGDDEGGDEDDARGKRARAVLLDEAVPVIACKAERQRHQQNEAEEAPG